MLGLLLLVSCCAEPTDLVAADYVIEGATIYDGSGTKPFRGDLVVREKQIVGIHRANEPIPKYAGNPRRIDARGLILAPGFIDLHTHCDLGAPKITEDKGRANANYLFQGVTTVVTGNCGSGPVDTAAYFRLLESDGVGTNVIHQAPHNSIRNQVMGNANRDPTPQELQQMQNLVEQAMKDGAFGLSTGLIYNPGTYAKTEEIIALAKIAARYQGFYASHIRDEGVNVLVALEEAIRIGREAKLPVHISHIKATGKKAWGKSVEEIALIERARREGLMVTADQYPYPASSTSLAATVVPARFREGKAEEYRRRFDDPEFAPKLRAAIEAAFDGRDGGSRIRIARYRTKPEWQGKDLATIAQMEGKSLVDIVFDIEKAGGASVINFGMSEEDVRLLMRQPWVATASDGSTQVESDTVPHPRSYGTFSRKIGYYAIAEKLIPLEQAIYSCTGLPAEILRLKDRGVVSVGKVADLVVFDPANFRDQATFDKPHQLTVGVRYLFVNGKLAIDQGKLSNPRAGQPIRRMP